MAIKHFSPLRHTLIHRRPGVQLNRCLERILSIFQIFKITGTKKREDRGDKRKKTAVDKCRHIPHPSETDVTQGISPFTLVKFSLSNLTLKSLFTPLKYSGCLRQDSSI